MTEFQTVYLASQNNFDLARLVEFAEFWKIPYEKNHNREHVNGSTFCSGILSQETSQHNPIIVSPRGFENARKIASGYNVTVARENSITHVLPLNRTNQVELRSESYKFTGTGIEPVIFSGGNNLLVRITGTNTFLLSIDLLGEYNRLLYENLEDSPSHRFKTVTRLPIPYNIIPGKIRDWSLRRQLHDQHLQKNYTPVEFLRVLFLAVLASVSDKPILRLKFWKAQKTYMTVVTHDVESKDGLVKASALSQVEQSERISSTWNIPSDRYTLQPGILRELATHGEIGAHDTLHDGRLILSPEPVKIIRLRQAKEKLERLSNTRIVGFRAPLLQHSPDLLHAVAKAGYEYDSSVPTFEYLSPTSSKPHGIGTIFPFEYEGTLEIPVSIPQDHQLTRIRQFSIKESMETMINEAQYIRTLGGVCVLLIHPDYEFGLPEHSEGYRRLLSYFTNDSECGTATMNELTQWWRLRMDSKIDLSTGEPKVVLPYNMDDASVPSMEIVTGYDKSGFRIKTWN